MDITFDEFFANIEYAMSNLSHANDEHLLENPVFNQLAHSSRKGHAASITQNGKVEGKHKNRHVKPENHHFALNHDFYYKASKELPRHPLVNLDRAITDLLNCIGHFSHTQEEYTKLRRKAHALSAPGSLGRRLYSQLRAQADDPRVESWIAGPLLKAIPRRPNNPARQQDLLPGPARKLGDGLNSTLPSRPSGDCIGSPATAVWTGPKLALLLRAAREKNAQIAKAGEGRNYFRLMDVLEVISHDAVNKGVPDTDAVPELFSDPVWHHSYPRLIMQTMIEKKLAQDSGYTMQDAGNVWMDYTGNEDSGVPCLSTSHWYRGMISYTPD
ncbi:uncharacterized protein DSM5745_09899 [Aspergillus mulundensis]|uniref:Uncharacterized protein n=1 Tax=Aspergillus mulundensis TaxID=1810919 RepID=A0A3D8QS36_9EURO|nr:hypothetical protein DSM5745_09899 [Aspergillus mulundensis]RDW64488.1 hypothetical protein DSM5745_09899 [Aspergillus mulundensis]